MVQVQAAPHVRTRMLGRIITLALAFPLTLALALALGGCGITIPTDPDGVFDRIEGGTLHAGASIDPGAVDAPDLTGTEQTGTDTSEPTGPMVDVVEAFARAHDASVEWEIGSEERLVRELEARDLDIVVGGITADTPWVDRVAVTRGYPEFSDDGRELVFLVPMGQNRLIAELEAFADRTVSRERAVRGDAGAER